MSFTLVALLPRVDGAGIDIWGWWMIVQEMLVSNFEVVVAAIGPFEIQFGHDDTTTNLESWVARRLRRLGRRAV
jgi:hypothetical protein